MTSNKLKYLYKNNNPNGHFFDRRTMLFFGDTMANFGVCNVVIDAITPNGIEKLEVYDLYRKKPVNGKLHGHCAYFRKDNGQVVYHHR